MRTRSLEAAKFIALQLEMLFTNPRRADVRRSWWRYSPNANRTDLQVRFPSHGGLTLAALVNVRWCIGSDVISSAVAVLFHRQTCTPQHGREGAVSAGHRVGLVRIQAELFHRLGDFPHLDLASTGELIESGQGD
jgi:hypothetical protein